MLNFCTSFKNKIAFFPANQYIIMLLAVHVKSLRLLEDYDAMLVTYFHHTDNGIGTSMCSGEIIFQCFDGCSRSSDRD
jgi:hypothetical protein